MMTFLLLFLLPLTGLCEKITNNHEYFVPNHQDCGLRSVNSSEPRTLNPWNAAVYTRQSSDSAWEYLVTGQVISSSAVVTIFHRDYGQRPRGGKVGQRYKLPSPEHVMVVAGLSSTDLLQADSNAAFASVKYIAPTGNSQDSGLGDYHVVIIRLLTPFNISTPFVRPICLPFFAQVAFEKFVVQTEQLGMMSGFYSAQPAGLLGNNTGSHFASILAPARMYEESRCKNYAKYYKAYNLQHHQFCGTLIQDGIQNDTCLTHGTAGVWESTETVIKFEPSFGPSPRFFLFSILFLVPEQEGGFCRASSPFISSSLIGVYDDIKGHLKCRSSTFPCTSERRCIQLSSVCDLNNDCADGEDEDPAFCKATLVCDPENEYQCGLYGKCIENNRTVDGMEDCPSGSDENPSLAEVSSQEDDQARTKCPPIEGFLNQLPEGLVATCTDAVGKGKNCTDVVADDVVTLTCGPRYSPAGRTSSNGVMCGWHGDWYSESFFRCEPKCGLLWNECSGGKCAHNANEDINETRFPWQALIFRWNDSTAQWDYSCAGSLIERNVILTSARCTVDAQGDSVKPDDLRIVLNGSSVDFAKSYVNHNRDVFWVTQTWRPPSFHSRTLKSDIAIIHLASPADFNDNIRPICFSHQKLRPPPAQSFSPSSGKLTGFRLTKNGEVPSGLKHFELNVTKNDLCGFSNDSSDKFCAQVLEGDDENFCHGDTGAGIIFPAKDKQSGAYVIKGVVSTEETGLKGCGKGGRAMSFTYVDSYTEWILSVIEGIDTNPYS